MLISASPGSCPMCRRKSYDDPAVRDKRATGKAKDMCGPMGLFMSEISFQKLTEEQQKNLLAAAAEASAAHTAMAPEKEAVSLAEMESSGVDIVEVDVDSFAKAVNEFNIKYCEEKGWTDVYNKIVG